jgi:hypothetical protein
MRTIALAGLAATTYALSKKEIAEIGGGVFVGFIEGGDFGDLSTCVQDLETVEHTAATAIADFKAGDLSDVVAGIKELGSLVGELKTALTDCKSIGEDDWKKILNAVELMTHPISFAYHVAKDILVNGIQIFHDVEDAKTNWDNQSYFNFGENVGDILEKILVGQVENEEPVTTFVGISMSQVAEIVNGVLMGALKAEHADDLVTCLKDADRTVEDLNEAYHDFKLKTAAGTASGLVALGHAMEDLGHDVEECASVVHLFETIVTWSHTFTNPISFAFHVGEDLLLNGVQIYDDIEDSITSWENGSYEKFGEDVGDALAKIIVGMDDMYVVQ